MAKRVYLVFLTFFCSTFFIASGRPIATEPRDDEDGAETILERLRQGDPNAWREHGVRVVDVVNQMVDQGLADDPFDALLLFFYPNSTSEERKETLQRFRPVLSAWMQMSRGKNRVDDDQFDSAEFDDSLYDHESGLNADAIDPVEVVVSKKKKSQGQKETPSYLDTHETPKGTAWRN